jgi:PPM family protein phosphatase
MYIQLHKPLAFSEKGRRGNNEDSIYPKTLEDTTSVSVFIICDGVGGASKGEVASQLCAQVIGEALGLNDSRNNDVVLSAVQKASEALDNYLAEHPDAEGMGTTLASLQLLSEGVMIAHMGDSRAYHIRGREVLFCTRDHSEVNLMIDQQLLSVEEAAQLGKTNIITRAIQAGSNKTVAPDVHLITDVQVGDYFFLCSDGTWECFNNASLLAIFNNKGWSNEQKLEHLKNVCAEKSNDNYSAYLLQVKAISNEPNTAPSLDTDLSDHNLGTKAYLNESKRNGRHQKLNKADNYQVEEVLDKPGFNYRPWLRVSALLILIGMGCFWYQKNGFHFGLNSNTSSLSEPTVPMQDMSTGLMDTSELYQSTSEVSAGVTDGHPVETKDGKGLAPTLNTAILMQQKAISRSQSKSDSIQKELMKQLKTKRDTNRPQESQIMDVEEETSQNPDHDN